MRLPAATYSLSLVVASFRMFTDVLRHLDSVSGSTTGSRDRLSASKASLLKYLRVLLMCFTTWLACFCISWAARRSLEEVPEEQGLRNRAPRKRRPDFPSLKLAQRAARGLAVPLCKAPEAGGATTRARETKSGRRAIGKDACTQQLFVRRQHECV